MFVVASFLFVSVVLAEDKERLVQKFFEIGSTKKHGAIIEYIEKVPDENGRLTAIAQWVYLNSGRFDLASKIESRLARKRVNVCEDFDEISAVKTPVKELLREAKTSRVLAFNESHTSLEQRLFLYQNLEALWEAGYRHIGYEALPWSFDFNLPLDQKEKAQGYILEPILSGSIRKAQKLGFKLFAYEANRKAPVTDDWKVKTDFRETEQARNVAEYIANIPESEKVLLWAGWRHISKKWDANDMSAEAWMAARLEVTHGVSVYSVDLTGCNYTASSPFSAVLGYKNERAWKIDHDEYLVDAQLRLPAIAADMTHPGQYRQVLGQETYLSDTIRQQSELMLLQAFRPEQAESSVPYDSVFMFAGENLPVYLPKGHFKLVSYASDGTKLGTENVKIK